MLTGTGPVEGGVALRYLTRVFISLRLSVDGTGGCDWGVADKVPHGPRGRASGRRMAVRCDETAPYSLPMFACFRAGILRCGVRITAVGKQCHHIS